MNLSSIAPIIGTAEQVVEAGSKLKKATEDIEAIFVKDLLAAMRRAVPDSSLGKGIAGDTYRDLFDNALSQSLGKAGALGISKILYRQMAPGTARAAYQKALQNLGNPMPKDHDKNL